MLVGFQWHSATAVPLKAQNDTPLSRYPTSCVRRSSIPLRRSLSRLTLSFTSLRSRFTTARLSNPPDFSNPPSLVLRTPSSFFIPSRRPFQMGSFASSWASSSPSAKNSSCNRPPREDARPASGRACSIDCSSAVRDVERWEMSELREGRRWAADSGAREATSEGSSLEGGERRRSCDSRRVN